MVFVIIVLIVQMWLLFASLEAFLAGNTAPALPALLASGVLCLCSFGLYRLVMRLDRSPEPDTGAPRSVHGPWDIA